MAAMPHLQSGAMTDTAILLRIHYWDEPLAAFAASLRAHLPYDLHIVADETAGAAPRLPYPTLGLTRDFVPSHGLFDRFPQVTWRCGDYFLYLARERLPGYRFYWMIEHDVRLHFANPHDCFRTFEASDADFIAANIALAEESWNWTNTMRGAHPVYRCAFPVVRLSGAAIDALVSERRRLAQAFVQERRDPTDWPNDEAFVTTTLHALKFQCRDINSFGRVLYDEQSYSFWTPTPLSAFNATRPDDKIHHPVLHGLHLYNKWMTIAFCTPSFDFDWFAGYVRSLTGREWDAAQAEYLLAHAQNMRQERLRELSNS